MKFEVIISKGMVVCTCVHTVHVCVFVVCSCHSLGYGNLVRLLGKFFACRAIPWLDIFH